MSHSRDPCTKDDTPGTLELPRLPVLHLPYLPSIKKWLRRLIFLLLPEVRSSIVPSILPSLELHGLGQELHRTPFVLLRVAVRRSL